MTKMNEERPILDSLKEKEKFSCSGILSHLNYVIERLKKTEVHSSEKETVQKSKATGTTQNVRKREVWWGFIIRNFEKKKYIYIYIVFIELFEWQ